MPILDEILLVKKDEVKKLRAEYNFSRFKDSKFYGQDRMSFLEALSSDNNISIIAEIKKASPSKGIIRNDFDFKKIADIYFENNVNAVSVLTDKNFFMGNINYLREIAHIKNCPLLRKDFIIDEYQIYEAKSSGADAILLIAEVLSKNQIDELSNAAFENDLEVLLEMHSKDQLEKINFGTNKIIGVNNRDLKTFNVNLQTTLDLVNKIPDDICIVSESGIHTEGDVDRLKETKVNAVLVGEHLMASESMSDAIRQIKEWCNREN